MHSKPNLFNSSGSFTIFAHRFDHNGFRDKDQLGDCTENSRQALDRASRRILDHAASSSLRLGVEFDVQQFQGKGGDTDAVVVHDATFERVMPQDHPLSTRPISDFSRDEFNLVSLLRPTDSVVFLSDVLTHELGQINIELKRNVGVKTDRLVGAVVSQIKRSVSSGSQSVRSFIVSSFDHDLLQTFHEAYPEIPTAVLVNSAHSCLRGLNVNTDTFIRTVSPILTRCGSQTINVDLILAQPELISACHEAGLLINVFTARSLDQFEYVLKSGADGVFVDYFQACISHYNDLTDTEAN
ncbi:MAG: glycerophosphodiester phosphodiesterase [bacterium]|nr:glycerophosphodiester phosphodiesterase [bacterium]